MPELVLWYAKRYCWAPRKRLTHHAKGLSIAIHALEVDTPAHRNYISCAHIPLDTPFSMSDIHDQLAKLDRQIIDLIGERMDLYRVALEEDEEGVGRDHTNESLAEWEEAAEEKGWSPGLMSKICRGIVEICRSGASDE